MEESKKQLFKSLQNLSSNPNELAKLSECFSDNEEITESDKIQNNLNQLDQVEIEEIQEITPQLFTDEPVEKEKKSSYKKGLDYAIRILGLRDYSTFKMKQKLKERGVTPSDIDLIIEKLLEYNYLREEEYTRMRIKQLIVKGYANSYILRKLAQEHLSADETTIDEIRDEQSLGTDDQLDKLINKKLRYKEIPNDFEAKMKLKNKIISFLASKGYKYDQIKNAIQDYFA